jgi:type IV pilus assembly protein PilE
MKYLKIQASKQGFTLIELMVTVTIVGILAMVAIPQYNRVVKRTEVEMAQGSLETFAAAMERHWSENLTYTGAAGTQASPANTGAPWIFPAEAPLDSNHKTYDLTIQAATASAFTLRAAPKDANDLAQDGYYEIDNTGEISHVIPASSS